MPLSLWATLKWLQDFAVVIMGRPKLKFGDHVTREDAWIPYTVIATGEKEVVAGHFWRVQVINFGRWLHARECEVTLQNVEYLGRITDGDDSRFEWRDKGYQTIKIRPKRPKWITLCKTDSRDPRIQLMTDASYRFSFDKSGTYTILVEASGDEHVSSGAARIVIHYDAKEPKGTKVEIENLIGEWRKA